MVIQEKYTLKYSQASEIESAESLVESIEALVGSVEALDRPFNYSGRLFKFLRLLKNAWKDRPGALGEFILIIIMYFQMYITFLTQF